MWDDGAGGLACLCGTEDGVWVIRLNAVPHASMGGADVGMDGQAGSNDAGAVEFGWWGLYRRRAGAAVGGAVWSEAQGTPGGRKAMAKGVEARGTLALGGLPVPGRLQ